MDDIESSPASPNPRKRSAPDDLSISERPLNLRGTQFVAPMPADAEDASDKSPATSSNVAADRDASPAPSTSTTLSSIESVPADLAPRANCLSATADTGVTPSSTAPPAKRLKMTPAERLQKEQEKEAKAREKADDKARKEEEKRVRDVDKQKKAEEREAKRRDKELEEERKAQEKVKKERSQMRLGAFFQAKPTTPAKSTDGNNGSTRRNSLPLDPFDAVADQIRQSISPKKKGTPAKTQTPLPAEKRSSATTSCSISDYHKTFLPFALPSHSSLSRTYGASEIRTSDAALGTFEQHIAISRSEAVDIGGYFPATTRGLVLPRVKDLVERITGSRQVIDLTQDVPPEIMTDVLEQIPVKHIHFHEDVRPAYRGTYTKIELTGASRTPFGRFRPDTDYSYDSEGEWEEPEEGEDIVSEDEDDADSQGDADEIDAFLDDSEEALKNPRRVITGDLLPESTGLCWADSTGRFKDPSDQMHGTSIRFLIAGRQMKSINPWSTDYWETGTSGVHTAVTNGNKSTSLSNDATAASRPPLLPRFSGNGSSATSHAGTVNGLKGPIAIVQGNSGVKRGRKAAARVLNKEDMDEFKTAVVDQDIGKLDLLKVLKIRFPKFTHETIKETLGRHFAQVGTTRSEKRWVFVGNA